MPRRRVWRGYVHTPGCTQNKWQLHHRITEALFLMSQVPAFSILCFIYALLKLNRIGKSPFPSNTEDPSTHRSLLCAIFPNWHAQKMGLTHAECWKQAHTESNSPVILIAGRVGDGTSKLRQTTYAKYRNTRNLRTMFGAINQTKKNVNDDILSAKQANLILLQVLLFINAFRCSTGVVIYSIYKGRSKCAKGIHLILLDQAKNFLRMALYSCKFSTSHLYTSAVNIVLRTAI